MINGRVVLIRNAQPYDFGGGERFPIFTAEQLKKHGYEPVIISQSPRLLEFAQDHSIMTVKGLWWRWQNWSGWRVVFFPVYLVWQTILFLWYVKLFKQLSPAAVHIQSKDDFIAASWAAKKVGAQVVWTDHADLKHIWINLTIWYKNPIGKLVYYAARKADVITVVSRSELSLVKSHLPASSSVLHKIKVIYNGVIDTSTSYTNKPTESITFCIASRLVKDKGIGEAIEAFNQVAIKYPAATLTILGDGPDKDLFHTQAENKPGIIFLGHQKDPLSYMAKAAIFLHPTYHEGFSVALVEASMLKRAIIATDVGGNPEIIIDGQTGLLIPPKDPAALAKAMLRLIEDPSLASRLGKNAYRQYTERFDFSKIVKEQFIPLYSKGQS